MDGTKDFKSQFMGLDGYVWFFATVVNRDDPAQLGRVQIRIFGLHSPDQNKIPDADLPWASPLQPINSAATNGVGSAPLGLIVGSIVHGFFLDGHDAQMPVITHAIAGKPGGQNDLPELALGTQTLPKSDKVGPEPKSPFAAQYPYNKVTVSESGHVLEIDDTPGKERLHQWHRKGTYTEIDAEGNRVVKVVGDGFDVTVGDKSIYVGGNANLFVKGNINVVAYNDVNLSVSGSLNMAVAEDIRMKANNIYMEAAKSIQALAGDYIALDAEDMYLAKDMAMDSGLNDPDPRALDFYVPKIDDNLFMGQDDDDSGEAIVARGIQNGTLDPSQGGPLKATESYSKQRTIAPKNINNCGIDITKFGNLSSIQMTPNFTVGDLSSHTAAFSHTIRAQNGLTVQNIVCNLKLLAENVLEPILAKYPDMIITCGFRPGNGSSRHHSGYAADLQYKTLNRMTNLKEIREAYYERACWIADNTPLDAILLEYKTYGTGLPWHHVQFLAGRAQRGLTQTYFNGSLKSSKLQLLQE